MKNATDSYQAIYQSPIGKLGLRSDGEALVSLALDHGQLKVDGEADEIIEQAILALDEYFANTETSDLPPIKMHGTPFQKKVWAHLKTIPAGKPQTYGEVAKKLGTHPRAVGGACRANPVVLLVPCHRVVAASGDGGFAGSADGEWPRIKHWLLQHESENYEGR